MLKGYNYRLPAIQAAILRVKLQRLEPWTEARRTLAAEYDRLLEDVGVATSGDATRRCATSIACTRFRPRIATGCSSELEAAGIQTAVHYPLPIHLMPAYADARYKAGDFPVAEACARQYFESCRCILR